jgi:undecaprenyl-diphosphatase
MAAAVGYDLFKNRDALDFSALSQIGVGFGVAFVTGVIVVKWLLGYIGRHGYSLFGWWRIIVGSLALSALSFGL